MDIQLGFQFVQEFERILSLSVQLIDENDDRSIPHAANLHELLRLLFDAFDTINDEDNAVYSC